MNHPSRRHLLVSLAGLLLSARALPAGLPPDLDTRPAEVRASGAPLLVLVLNEGRQTSRVSYGELWAEILHSPASVLTPVARLAVAAMHVLDVDVAFPTVASANEPPLALVVWPETLALLSFPPPALHPWPPGPGHWTWREVGPADTVQQRYEAARANVVAARQTAISQWLQNIGATAGVRPGDGGAWRARVLDEVPGAAWYRREGCGWVDVHASRSTGGTAADCPVEVPWLLRPALER